MISDEEKLVGWLETVSYILNSFSVQLLERAIPVANRIGKLQGEKIKDQAKILELQREFILKRDDELNWNTVETTVQNEMKGY